MLDWIVEGIRWLVWGLTSAALTLMDTCYDLVLKIASADFLSSSTVWQWYYVIMTFLGVFIVVRVAALFFKYSFDEEFRDKVSVSNLLTKLIAIAIVVTLLPMAVGFVSKVSIWSLNNINMVIGTQSSSKPSTFIITSFMNTDNGKFDKDGNWVEGKKVTYTLKDVDINKAGEGKDDYKYFNSVTDLFIVTFIGITASIMLIINGIQIGKRMYALVMKILIAPIPISSLIIPGDETFSMWRKMIVSDYILNYIQTLMIMIVMILSGSQIVQHCGVWVQILSFIAGLLLLLSGIPELAKIIGGDTSQASVLQQIASFRMATRGVGHGLATAAKPMIGAAGLGAAAATYGGGRMLGGQSIKEFSKSQDGANANGFMGGGGGVDEGGQQGYRSSNANSNANKNESKNDQNNHNANNENHKQEGDVNYMNNTGSSSTSTAFGGEHTQANMSTSGANIDAGRANTSENGQEQGQGQGQGYAHSSREGTNARSFSDRAQQMSGIRGTGARFASNASSHMYQSSMKKIQSSKLYHAANKTANLTSRREPGGK